MYSGLRIGFIGLGIMGKEMVRNLINHGYRPLIYNKTREKCYEFEKYGISIAPTPSIMAQSVESIIIMVEDDNAVRDVLEGPNGVFSGFKKGNYLINMSTISHDFSLYLSSECKKRGIRFLDCPVSGSKKQAQDRELIILASGEEEDVKKFSKLLLSMGKDIIYTGNIPSATVVKLTINLLLAFMTAGIVESAVLAERSGISPELIFEVIEKSPVLNCGFFKGKKNNIIKNDFSTSFSVKNLLKDLKYILKLAESKNLKLDAGYSLKEIFEKTFSQGYYNQDITAIKKIY